MQAVLQYDTLNRISALATQQTGYTYQRGPTGNLTQAAESNGRTVNWTYDGIYQLSSGVMRLLAEKRRLFRSVDFSNRKRS